MLAVVPIAILMMSMMVAFVGTSVETSRATVGSLEDFRARAAAQNAANIAINDLWSDFQSTVGRGAQLWEFREFLDEEGLRTAEAVAQSQPFGGAPTGQWGYGDDDDDDDDDDWDDDDDGPGRGNGEPLHNDNVLTTSHLSRLALHQNHLGRSILDGIEIESLSISRIDDFDSTSIVVDVEAVNRVGQDGSSRESRVAIQEIFTVAAPEWGGLNYALLANNINCLLCHTKIDSATRFYNNDASLAGTFDAVRVGSLESIHFREDPDSSIAGVALIGGDAMLGDGDSIHDWTQFNLSGAMAGPGGTVDKIVEDQFGNALTDELLVYDPDAPDAAANMFLDFHTYGDDTDYTLPRSFPSPFPDDGGVDPGTDEATPEYAGNRVVDDTEFFATVRGSDGSISGGDITVVEHGDRIDRNNERARMRTGLDDSIAGITDGNVYLHGKKNDPLILDGDIAIDGDVIISGYVKGEGTLRARGNVYVASDIHYADGGGRNRTFGKAADGTKNSLAIAAGGNLVLGNFYRPAFGRGGVPANGTSAGSFNFTMDEIAIFNRNEWMKTQPTLPGQEVKTQTGVDVTWIDEKVKEYYWKTVTNWKWVKTGNKIKKTKYKWVNVSNGLPAPYTKITKKKVPNGFYWVDEKVKVAAGTKRVQKSRWVKTGNKIRKETPIYEWIAPEHDNPYYVAGHTPRYYSFAEGAPVPIFNREGHFDPASEHWVSEERPGAWDTSKLTIARPGDTSDDILYDANGKPKAVVSVIGPTADWISPAMLKKTIELEIAGQGSTKELEIDATLYSANSILGTIPNRASRFNGELLVNGGIVAADVGILAPNGTQVNYDDRAGRRLSIASDEGVQIFRRLSAPRPTL